MDAVLRDGKRLVAKWQRLLRLQHKRIWVVLDPEYEGAAATAITDGRNDDAVITLSTKVNRTGEARKVGDTWERPVDLEEDVVHELLHCISPGLTDVAEIAKATMGETWHQVARSEIERLIDFLAVSLVRQEREKEKLYELRVS